MSTTQDEDVVGKAYDARLMRRLLQYLRPYGGPAALALVAIIANSMLQLAQPYLMKLAIDRYIPAGSMAGMNRIALDCEWKSDAFVPCFDRWPP